MDVSAKHVALKLIQAMPDSVSVEDITYELYFRQRIDRGLDDLEQGRLVSHEEVKESLA